jgi:hypothetical protein
LEGSAYILKTDATLGQEASTLKAIIIKAVGMLLIGAAFVLFLLSFQIGLIAAVTTAPLAGVFSVAGFYVMRAARQLQAAEALQRLENETRAPVLYLRTFGSESLTSKGLPTAFPLFDEGIVSEEEQLAKVVFEIGPFIAIGRPGERLPTLGAVRLYADDPDWHDNVADLLSIAVLVILRVGATGSLLWEVRQVLQRTPPDRLVLLVPDNQTEYECFCDLVDEQFPEGLPNYPVTPSLLTNTGSVRGLIRFDTDWRASFEELRPPPLIHARHQMLVPVYKYALRPVFEQLGVPWQPPGLNWHFIASMVFFVALFGVFALMITRDAGWS